jgi:undecaprenyl-diphosphatase
MQIAAQIERWRLWLNQHVDLLMLVAVLILVGGVYTFAWISDLVTRGSVQHFDEAALHALRNPANPAEPVGPRWVSEAARDITGLGGPAVLVIVTAAVAGYLVIRRMFGLLAVLLAANLGGLANTLLLKYIYERPRPEIVPYLSHVYTTSFPSGHSMLAAVVYLTLGTLLARLVSQYRHKIYIVGVAMVITILVGISRVYMGVHYPSDVLAGWAAGLSWAVLVWLAAYWLQKKKGV